MYSCQVKILFLLTSLMSLTLLQWCRSVLWDVSVHHDITVGCGYRINKAHFWPHSVSEMKETWNFQSERTVEKMLFSPGFKLLFSVLCSLYVYRSLLHCVFTMNVLVFTHDTPTKLRQTFCTDGKTHFSNPKQLFANAIFLLNTPLVIH